MTSLSVSDSAFDFSSVRSGMQAYIDSDILSGVSFAVLHGQDLVGLDCIGWADRENKIAMREDHIFRLFSSTKIITCYGALLLLEKGKFQLDEPIEKYLPELANRMALKPGATQIDDVEPARRSITIRDLMCHSSGLSYGLFDPGTIMYKAYTDSNVRSDEFTLAGIVEGLAALPLSYHPGESWEYSISIDVLARLIEVVSGQQFDQYLQTQLFTPLGMVDTSHVIKQSEQHRLVTMYAGDKPDNLQHPGIVRSDTVFARTANLQDSVRFGGGGGMVSTLADSIALMKSLLPGGPALLKPETIQLLMRNQLKPGIHLSFPNFASLSGLGHSVGGALCRQASEADPYSRPGDLLWGGLAGTHWWISPSTGLCAIIMTQRHWSFWQPFSHEFKRLVYAAYDAGVEGN